MTQLGARIAQWTVRHRWQVILVMLLVAASAGSGIRSLTFNNDLRVFFSEQNPQLRALEDLEATYNKIDNVLFVIAPRDGNVFTRATLAAIGELTEAVWQTPYSVRVDSITNFQHSRAEGDDLTVEDLVENAGNLTDAELARIRAIALAEPSLVNRLVSATGHVTAINVTIPLPGASMAEVPEVAAFVRQLAGDFRQRHPDIDLYLTGAVMFDNGFAEVVQDDMRTLVPFMFAVLVVITGMALRSLLATLATLVIILASMLTGMGLAGWLGMSLNPASSNAPVIILTLAVADSVHILVTLMQQLRLGKTRQQAITESLRINFQAVFLTSVTTAIGFLTMNLSDAPPFRDLGNIVALGVMAALLYSVLLLPALMAVLPLRVAPLNTATPPRLDRLARFVIARRVPVYRAAWVAIAVASAGMLQIEFSDDWVQYFDNRYELRIATDFMEDNLLGAHIIEYSLDSGEPGSISEPDYLATLEAFADWYREQPRVGHVQTIIGTMKRLNRNMHGDDPAYYRLPEQRELAAQYLLLYEMSLPYGLDLNNQINVDKSATRMIVTLKGISTLELRALEERAHAWLKANAPVHMLTHGSGLSMIWAHISRRNINSMLGAAFIALLLISALLVFALRSLRLGIISLFPNLAPAFMAFGTWGLIVGQVGLGLSVVVSLTLGIVVDDTVHFLSHYLRARRDEGLEVAAAIRYSFGTVGMAMWITTVTLVAGFLVLTFSGYKMNADMGLLSAITLSLALLMDFLFLPALLMKLDRDRDDANSK
ncbi:MAG: MMPL family transporter [Halobacteria archaeon]|nr:MMPL family transporter [Halobacteria archaeon]